MVIMTILRQSVLDLTLNIPIMHSLMHYFSSFGPVKECIVMMNVKTGRSRGFGFVTFMDPGTVQYVISTQPHHLDGKMIDPKRCSPRSERPEKRDDSPKVFVGGLPPTVTQSELERFFSQYGVVTEVIIMFDQERQRPRGFGFIGFEGPDAVDRLVEEHYVTISGKKVEIKRAEPRDVKSRPLISTNYNQNSYGNYNQGPRPYMGQGPRWMGPGQNMGGPNQDWNEYGGQGNWENYSGGDGNWGPPNMGGPQQWGPRPGGPQQYGPGGPQQNYGPAQGGPAQNYGPQQGGPQSYGPPQGGPPQNYGGPPAGGPPQSYGGPPAGGPSQNYGGPPAGGPQSYGGPGGWQSGPMDPQGNYGPTDGSYGPPQQAPAPVPPANPAGGPNNFWAQWNDTSNQAPAPVAKPGADTVQYPMPGAQGAGAGLNQVPGGPAPVRGPYPSYQSQTILMALFML
ncbi:unnamed protein product [Notodromas monacha]|uniref:RRM domain-containing protein n=1 Tax=Notodromas monacha TaxID=399045 RepID=A0A7R9GEF0_9CRUS|nr:unnamed protein product [Notodromas monacha]CAG0918202.1 unnamed protein product [Notodromas monacha]